MVDVAHFIASAETFLRVTAERRLPESQDFLADRVEFVYPNGTFHDIAEVFAAGEQRYRWVRKRHNSWDVVEKDDGTVVVISVGTLYGENNGGQAFEDVRYVDRITFADERIVRQQVWNDLAESGVLGAPAAPNMEFESAVVQHEQEKP